MIYREVKRVNPVSSHHKEKIFFPLFFSSFFSFYGIYKRRWMLAEPTVVIISQYTYVNETIVLYALNLYRVIGHLYLNNFLLLIKYKLWKVKHCFHLRIFWSWDFPGGAVVKNAPANAGDTGSSPGPGRSHMPQSN